jgi:hypothetical protein
MPALMAAFCPGRLERLLIRLFSGYSPLGLARERQMTLCAPQA